MNKPGCRRRLLQNPKALSIVVTTLIILVASVVLGASVALYGVNIFQARGQEEAFFVSNAHLWVNSTGQEGAFVVKNTGSRDTAIREITVRGSIVPISNVYYWIANASITSELTVTKTLMTNDTATASSVIITVDGVQRTFLQSTGPVGLSPGQTAVIYLNKPTTVDATDAGTDATMGISGSQAASTVRVTVQSAS